MDLKIQENDLQNRIELLTQTCKWYNFFIGRKMARYQSLMQRIEREDVPDESLFEECVELEKQIKILSLKGEFEKREQEKIQKMAHEFEKNQQKNFKKILSQKLAKKFKHN